MLSLHTDCTILSRMSWIKVNGAYLSLSANVTTKHQTKKKRKRTVMVIFRLRVVLFVTRWQYGTGSSVLVTRKPPAAMCGERPLQESHTTRFRNIVLRVLPSYTHVSCLYMYRHVYVLMYVCVCVSILVYRLSPWLHVLYSHIHTHHYYWMPGVLLWKWMLCARAHTHELIPCGFSSTYIQHS